MSAEESHLPERRSAGPTEMPGAPDALTAKLNEAVCHLRARNPELARAACEEALKLAPESHDALHFLGLAHLSRGDGAEGIACIEKAIALFPSFPQALNNLGLALKGQGRTSDAIVSFRKALAVQPESVEAWNNLGNTLKEQGAIEEALTAFRNAVALRPDFAETYNNMGNAFLDRKAFDEAIGCYRKAEALVPGYVEPHWNESFALLAMGAFAEGWKAYEWRWKRPRALPQRGRGRPLWRNGGDLSGKSILLYAEQGYGDTLQFVRYVRMVAERNPRVIHLEVQPALVPLLAGLPDVEVCGWDEPLPDFDLQCPLMSLPLVFATTPQAIPAAVPYITAPVDRVALWQERFASVKEPKIGVAWAGNPTQTNDRNRSIPFPAFKALFENRGCRFYALQKDVREHDVPLLGATPVEDLSREIRDFADTAAIIAHMDLVVSVDTSLAHLAGAMGHPVWIALAFAPDWRWYPESEASPWYPTARLFRQRSPGAWARVMAEIGRELDRRFGPTS